MKNKFTFQILGNINYDSYQALYSKLLELFQNLSGSEITTLNLTAWQDGNGNLRKFNEDGVEIIDRPNEITLTPEQKDELEQQEGSVDVIEIKA